MCLLTVSAKRHRTGVRIVARPTCFPPRQCITLQRTSEKSCKEFGFLAQIVWSLLYFITQEEENIGLLTAAHVSHLSNVA